MREIKFRCWDKINKKWTDAFPWGIASIKDIPFPVFNLEEFVVACGGEMDLDIQQDTGLKDKNEKSIFEGDILKQNIKNEYGSFQEIIGVMEWKQEWAQFTIKFSVEEVHNFQGEAQPPEIIGNIYDNPELLTRSTVN